MFTERVRVISVKQCNGVKQEPPCPCKDDAASSITRQESHSSDNSLKLPKQQNDP